MDVFIALKDTLEQELQRTGFKQPEAPPIGEPEMPRRLRELAIDDLVDLVDDFQVFYNYLSDEITRVLTFEGITKAQVDLQYALAKKEAALNKELTNESARNIEVETNEVYLGAVADYLYFKQGHAQLEERRRKISKSIERLYRELMYRDQSLASRGGQNYGQHANRAPMPSQYKGAIRRKERPSEPVRPASSEDGVSGKDPAPPPERQQDVHQDQVRDGPVQRDEGVSVESNDRVDETAAPRLPKTGPEPASPFSAEYLRAIALQRGVSEDDKKSVQKERRVKPDKGRGGPDCDYY